MTWEAQPNPWGVLGGILSPQDWRPQRDTDAFGRAMFSAGYYWRREIYTKRQRRILGRSQETNSQAKVRGSDILSACYAEDAE